METLDWPVRLVLFIVRLPVNDCTGSDHATVIFLTVYRVKNRDMIFLTVNIGGGEEYFRFITVYGWKNRNMIFQTVYIGWKNKEIIFLTVFIG